MIERKDVWKTEGFPIWRIETGKLLQKFDPVPVVDGIVHKSASVVCMYVTGSCVDRWMTR